MCDAQMQRGGGVESGNWGAWNLNLKNLELPLPPNFELQNTLSRPLTSDHMLPIIEALLVLQDKDRRLIRLRAELEAVPVQRQLLQSKAAKTQAAFDEVKKRATHIESERKRLELEAGTLQQRINKLRDQAKDLLRQAAEIEKEAST